MGLQEEFDLAADEASHALPDTVTQEEKLQIYGLFKQSKEGDVSTGCPNIFDLKGRAKWFAWESSKGLTKDAAMQAYITFVAEMKAKHGSTRSVPANA